MNQGCHFQPYKLPKKAGEKDDGQVETSDGIAPGRHFSHGLVVVLGVGNHCELVGGLNGPGDGLVLDKKSLRDVRRCDL